MQIDGKKTTPEKAAKLAYLACAEQVLMDVDMALDFAQVDGVTPAERIAFHKGLRSVSKCVRKLLCACDTLR